MGKSQRQKGSAGERDVMKRFNAALGTNEKRHLGQARDGGHDGKVGRYRIEVKRRQRIAVVSQWYAQVCKGALPNEIPLVALREDRGAWKVLLSLDDFLGLIHREPSLREVADKTAFEIATAMGINLPHVP